MSTNVFLMKVHNNLIFVPVALGNLSQRKFHGLFIVNVKRECVSCLMVAEVNEQQQHNNHNQNRNR